MARYRVANMIEAVPAMADLLHHVVLCPLATKELYQDPADLTSRRLAAEDSV